MKYPAGDEEGRHLFLQLERRMEQGLLDDDFLRLLVDYRSKYPEWEHFDIFYARYAAHHGNYEVALEHARMAYRKRKVNFEVWKLLAECYMALGKPEKAVPFQAYCCKFYTGRLDLAMPVDRIEKCLGELSVAMGYATYAPFCDKRMFLFGKELKAGASMFAGEYIPGSEDDEGYPYWVGAYNELSRKGARGKLLEVGIYANGLVQAHGADCVFDIMRSRMTGNITIEPKGAPVVVPMAGTTDRQKVDFQTPGFRNSSWLGKWEYSFFRIDERTEISSGEPLSVGRPIRLGHSAGRRRFVLNILVDGLGWNSLCRHGKCYMPNTMEFFGDGVIFSQHYSVGEYTYPVLPAIETGMYPHHSQIFHERAAIPLDREYLTLSEAMRKLGYYCTNVMGAGDAVYNGATRGYERLLVNSYDLPAYVGVERVLRQLEAFSECDQFIFLHLMETHPWSVVDFPSVLGVQTKTPLEERKEQDEDVPSVDLPPYALHQREHRQGMEYADRSLKHLFDYIAGHYGKEEYIIQLYSDHGVSIYDEEIEYMSDNQTHATYMLKGHGVPSVGVAEELTSAVDIYPVLAKLAGFSVGEWVDGNLPAAFGGKERNCVYSNSLFPGKVYQLCIRTKEHEFLLKTAEPVDEDGTVDFRGADLSVHARDAGGKRICDPAVVEHFLGLAREYTASFHHGGRRWRSMAEARPEWFASTSDGK